MIWDLNLCLVEGDFLYVCSANLTYSVPDTVQDADLSCTQYTSSAVTVIRSTTKKSHPNMFIQLNPKY